MAFELWDAVAYLALTLIIVGVFWERGRNFLFAAGSVILAAYAWFFLNNTLFAILQALIIVSAILAIEKVSKIRTATILIALTVIAYILLILSNWITDIWSLLGSFGLIGIAFGLVVLPARWGFILMAIGGVLLTIYSVAVSAIVFLLLNIFFSIANIVNYVRRRAG